jgi:hypothetical protein
VTLPGKARVPVRICARRKDEEACEKSRKKLKRRASRKGSNLREKTVSFNEFIVVATPLPASVAAQDALEA